MAKLVHSVELGLYTAGLCCNTPLRGKRRCKEHDLSESRKESGAVKISFSFAAEVMGEETSARIMRQYLEAMIKDAHLYMKGSFYLFGETSLDITKDSRFRSVMRVVGPQLRALPPESDLAKAVSVTSKLKQHAAAEALGSLYYGPSIRTTLEGLDSEVVVAHRQR